MAAGSSTRITGPHLSPCCRGPVVALVGYEGVNAVGGCLLDESVLNAVLVLVAVSAIVGPVLTERALRRLKA